MSWVEDFYAEIEAAMLRPINPNCTCPKDRLPPPTWVCPCEESA